MNISLLEIGLKESPKQHGGGGDRGGEDSATEEDGWKLRVRMGQVSITDMAGRRSVVAVRRSVAVAIRVVVPLRHAVVEGVARQITGMINNRQLSVAGFEGLWGGSILIPQMRNIVQQRRRL